MAYNQQDKEETNQGELLIWNRYSNLKFVKPFEIFQHSLAAKKKIHSLKLTFSPLKMVVSNRNFRFQGSIFRSYVSFRLGRGMFFWLRSSWWMGRQRERCGSHGFFHSLHCLAEIQQFHLHKTSSFTYITSKKTGYYNFIARMGDMGPNKYPRDIRCIWG